MTTTTRGRQCEGKFRFPNWPAAQKALVGMAKRTGTALSRLRAYQCPHCSKPGDAGWHIGHVGKRSRGKK